MSWPEERRLAQSIDGLALSAEMSRIITALKHPPHEEIRLRVSALRHEHPTLSEVDATTIVCRDRRLYDAYVTAHTHQVNAQVVTPPAPVARALSTWRDSAQRRLSTVSRLDTTSADTSVSWIQVAVVGHFVSKAYGEFSITTDDLRSMYRNFTYGVHPVPPTKICMDYDHFSTSPGRPGDGKAAGWFVALQLRAGDTELWGRIEWTEDGAAAIRKKEYQYVSPTFSHNFLTPAGTEIGCTLLASAITNSPFLQGMEPLSLAATA